eukprot:CAMPEP_0198328516 /NCGR_PEP_ID=MMETSP1450-20131203/15532_1 /TAXON_ID=753684 ORGANISM="Madagascaria erythrocladiodes, Strain CCMP3234" /NCGR_SAMPLE_ID=MMETSP1450 /ASSEMBLY_ACC=CAM_ASM_001115 /LENGTH=392 /DNA_ID=CAMNT_0044032659 /DNA_START=395 /DNA_END=1573 /DNA_ORIENTATION=+
MTKTTVSLSLALAAMLLSIANAAPCADVCCDPTNSGANFRTRCESSSGLLIRCRQFDGCKCSSDYCFGETARPGTSCIPRSGQDPEKCRIQFSCANCDSLGPEAPCFDGRDKSTCPKAKPGLEQCSTVCKLDCSGSPGLAQEPCIDDKTGDARTCSCLDLAPSTLNPLFVDMQLENCVFPTSFFADELRVAASLKNVGITSMIATSGGIRFEKEVLNSTICRLTATEDIVFDGSVADLTSLVIEAARDRGQMDIRGDFVDSRVGTIKAPFIRVRGSFSRNALQVMAAEHRIIVTGEIRLSKFENFAITGQPLNDRLQDQVLDLQPGARFEVNEIESFAASALQAFSGSTFVENEMGFVVLTDCSLSSGALGADNTFDRRLVTEEIVCELMFE